MVNMTIKDGKLIIVCDLDKGTPSASGKTLVVASTHGNVKTALMHEGKNITVGLNAYIPNKI